MYMNIKNRIKEVESHRSKLEKLKAASALPEMSPAPRMNMELPKFKPIDTEFTSKLKADMAANRAEILVDRWVTSCDSYDFV